MSEPTPVTVITGFLGAGKTTLLNQLLRHSGLADTAVIINEFGAVELDHWLVEGGDEEVVSLGQGCVCCSLQGDFVGTLRRLFQQAAGGEIPRFRRVLVETTGLVDPGPVVQVLLRDPLLAAETRLGGVLTLIDAEHGVAALDEHPEAQRQAAMADRLILTKTDRVAADAADAVEGALLARGLRAPLLRWSRGDPLDPARLLDIGVAASEDGNGLRRWLQLDRLSPVPEAAPPVSGFALAGQAAGAHHHHGDITTLCLTHDKPMAPADLQAFLDTACELHGRHLLRLKGVACLQGQAERPVVVHAVRGLQYPPAQLPAWPEGINGTTMVCIGEALRDEALRDLWRYAVTR